MQVNTYHQTKVTGNILTSHAQYRMSAMQGRMSGYDTGLGFLEKSKGNCACN